MYSHESILKSLSSIYGENKIPQINRGKANDNDAADQIVSLDERPINEIIEKLEADGKDVEQFKKGLEQRSETIGIAMRLGGGGGKTRSKITQRKEYRKETVQEIKEDEKILSPIQKTLSILFVGLRTNNNKYIKTYTSEDLKPHP
jgi:hypothetical protein